MPQKDNGPRRVCLDLFPEVLGVIPEDESILVASNHGMPVAMTSANGSSANDGNLVNGFV